VTAQPQSLVLYDQDCAFCKWSLDKILAWDRSERLRAVAIQSEAGERLLAGVDPELASTRGIWSATAKCSRPALRPSRWLDSSPGGVHWPPSSAPFPASPSAPIATSPATATAGHGCYASAPIASCDERESTGDPIVANVPPGGGPSLWVPRTRSWACRPSLPSAVFGIFLTSHAASDRPFWVVAP
jgi:hypothetical protein